MKNYIFILLISFFIFSCNKNSSHNKQISESKWTIKDVFNITEKRSSPKELNKGTLWYFKKDHSFKFSVDNDISKNEFDGKWKIHNDSLLLKLDTETMNFKINHIDSNTLILTLCKKDCLEFTLNKQK
jgi:hypothetical protein